MRRRHSRGPCLALAAVAVRLLWAPQPALADAGAYAPQWMPLAAGAGVSLQVPRDNWKVVGQRLPAQAGGRPDLRLLAGNRWISLGREEAGTLGLDAARVASASSALAGNGSYVYARYDPASAQLRVFVNRVEVLPTGAARSLIADFTPHHGRWWAAARTYLTPVEAADPQRAGPDPFAAFAGDLTDPVFHGINWAAAQVAVGHAMRRYRAVLGLIAVARERLDVQTSEDGNLFRKTVTTRVSGYATADWWLALPADVQPGGTGAQICVQAAAAGCDAPAHVAVSGVSVARWSGGNLPAPEQPVYSWETSRSAFTVFAFAALTALLVLTGASLAAGALGDGALAPALVAPPGLDATTAAALFSPGSLASLSGGSYALASTALGQGSSVLSAQERYLGQTGDGRLVPPAPGSEQEAALRGVVRGLHIGADWNGGLQAARQLFAGDCDPAATVAQCQATTQTAGVVHRPDSAARFRAVEALQARLDACQQQGLTGADLQRCVGPGR